MRHDMVFKKHPNNLLQRMHEGRGETSEDKLESEREGREDAGQTGAMGERNRGNETISLTSCHSIASSPSKPSAVRRPLAHHLHGATPATPCAIPKACKSGIPNPT